MVSTRSIADTNLEEVGLESKTCPIDVSCVDNVSDHDFDCSICYQVPLDPVVTPCGHLFCWPCLYKWLHTFSQSNQCPICKNRVEENSLVPIFGKGRARSSSADHSSDIPSRPIAFGKTRASSRTTNQNSGFYTIITRQSISTTRRLTRIHALTGILLVALLALSIYYFLGSETMMSPSSSAESLGVGVSAMIGAQMFGAGYAVGGVVAAVLVMCLDIRLEDVGLETKTCPIDTSCVDNAGDNYFDCSICYQEPLDPVVTLCGHLFCWPCLYKWLHTFSRSNRCPICKNRIEENSLVPIFSKGSAISSSADYSSNILSRPIAQGKIGSSHTNNHNSGFNTMTTRQIRSITRRLAHVHALVHALIGIVSVELSIYYFLGPKTTLSSSSSIESFGAGWLSAMAGAYFMFGAGYAVSNVITVVIVMCLDIRVQRLLRHLFSICQDFLFRLFRY
ncbi:hypothetical protein TIFTF001_006831 [Ficus carica]|uniref:E3 ubiquitin-protein ligase RMA n=1 Tax=Ficus carica TaxID=3494 RepID=A0AA87ZPS1_FICCA|nr:hypothetical protein TIFTF001_006831 [Ficus carica]